MSLGKGQDHHLRSNTKDENCHSVQLNATVEKIYGQRKIRNMLGSHTQMRTRMRELEDHPQKQYVL